MRRKYTDSAVVLHVAFPGLYREDVHASCLYSAFVLFSKIYCTGCVYGVLHQTSSQSFLTRCIASLDLSRTKWGNHTPTISKHSVRTKCVKAGVHLCTLAKRHKGVCVHAFHCGADTVVQPTFVPHLFWFLIFILAVFFLCFPSNKYPG